MFVISGSPISLLEKHNTLRSSFVILFTFLSTISYGQWNNSFFDQERNDTSVGSFRIFVENLNYVRNTEYKTDITEGRTLLGFQLWPELNYQLGAGTQVALGWYSQRDFGGENWRTNRPTFYIQHRKNSHLFRFGTLMGATQHQMIEPLYDPENVIDNRLEEGFQYFRNTKRLDTELWLNWTKAIYRNSPFREEFTAGLRGELVVLDKEKHKLTVPGTLLAFHKGGEIDTSKMQAESRYNMSYGLRYCFKPNDFIDSIDVRGYGLNYEDVSPKPINYVNGLGQYLSVAMYARGFGVMLNYYDAHQFYNPSGDPVYRSVSIRNPLYIRDYRKVGMLRASWETQMTENMRFLFRANIMREFNQSTTDVIAEFYIRWTPEFMIKKG